jgi:predicted transposase YdaD
MPPPQNPHDALFRAVFRVPRYAAGLLKIVLPAKVVALLDLDRIDVLDAAHVSPPLRGSASDVVLQVARRAAGGPLESEATPALIVFAVEHQSREEHFMALRQLQYETRLWEGWLRDHPGATRLPPIVPVVVHTGPTPWRAPTRFQALVDLPAPPSDTLLRPFTPDFSLVLLDLADETVTRAWLRAAGDEPVSETTLEIMQAAAGPEAEALFDAWLARLEPLRTEAGGASTLAAILCYLLYVSPIPGRRIVRAADTLPASAQEEIMTGAQQLIEQGRQEGRQEGEHGALAGMLLRLAARRFGVVPPEMAARIEAASTPELERWLEGLLAAERLDDLLG